MNNQFLFMISIFIFFIGAFLIGLSGMVYEWRAFTNKKAWNGLTKPLLFIGLPVTLIGIALIYLFYPYK